ncbi:YbaB/EbfC family nucleoid-associated protein [Actinokineospora auranticolor]|uniref:YbaB/EbfC DNA-binding family protein n=1 Tax=Actinokineospora auranticolor TaxID=155976 RepID=A0A2S6GG77_9PSEU|nr:YbaB/EbfC family nucleoid-associated protein [Actinokineospora auranticolor]PPK64203.1 YbaB/EbfC DNA-binding family protein [Actinokineospora auranticolor]
MQTPDEWLADFEAKVADLQQRATEFKQDVESAATTEQSPDGAITVAVAPNGALTDLRLTDSAMTRPAAELAADILALTRHARQTAATTVASAFAPLGGDASVVQHIAEPKADQPPRPHDPEADYSDSPAVYRNESW